VVETWYDWCLCVMVFKCSIARTMVLVAVVFGGVCVMSMCCDGVPVCKEQTLICR